MPQGQKIVKKQDDIIEAFQVQQNKNEVAEVLKELFEEKKIFLITELSKDEIKLMTRIYTIADMKGLEHWKKGLVTFSKLMLSNKRGSRKEILDAIGRYISGGGVEGKGAFRSFIDGFRRR